MKSRNLYQLKPLLWNIARLLKQLNWMPMYFFFRWASLRWKNVTLCKEYFSTAFILYCIRQSLPLTKIPVWFVLLKCIAMFTVVWILYIWPLQHFPLMNLASPCQSPIISLKYTSLGWLRYSILTEGLAFKFKWYDNVGCFAMINQYHRYQTIMLLTNIPRKH